ncbi:MAG TPA: RDD family protein [Thermoanaerobaculia bacterium]|nr:RDD family protein [Thermoanaerobaculia bacterium]
MFCPHCGVKNDGTPLQCASCKKSIPPIDAAARVPAAAQSRPQRPARPLSPTESFSSVGDRMLALAFDRVVVAAFLLIGAAALVDYWKADSPRPSDLVTGVLAGVVAVTAAFLYHVIFEAGFGTTLGKAVMGLQVRTDGQRGRFLAAIIRNALRIVDGLALYLVGFLTATFSQRRQRFGDAVAGTVVLNMPMSKGVRAAMMLLWLALVATGIGIAAAICPECGSFTVNR